MVDNLRRELTLVARKCENIVLEREDINKILNGQYQEVINEYNQESLRTQSVVENIEEIAMPPAPVIESPVEPSDPNYIPPVDQE